jgi:uncharacterized protein YcgI (DUF1989 family)
MEVVEQGLIPARKAIAVKLLKGQRVRVVNVHGQQVVDTWAFSTQDPAEFMSMEHSRVGIKRLSPRLGDAMLTNRRRPIVTLAEDTSGGAHDTLIAACDIYRYHALGYKGHHDNCTENLAYALKQVGRTAAQTPCPLNLFMNIPWTAEGKLSFEPPVSRAGDYVALGAEMDCIIVLSACPQDMVPINGAACVPRDASFEVLA